MKLIELLLDNWVILVVVFFMISSLFKKKAAAGKQEQQSSPRTRKEQRRSSAPAGMPPFGGGGTGWPARTSKPSKEQSAPKSAKTTAGTPKPAAAREASLPEGSAGNRSIPSVVITEAQDQLEEAHSTSEKPLEPAAKPAQSEPVLRPEDALKGVLWAEILGPPRAKRPYRR